MAQKRLGHLLAAVVIVLAAGLIVPVSPASADIVDITISGFKTPRSIAINPAGTFAYVTNLNLSTVSRINLATNKVDRTIAGVLAPTYITINPAGTFAYVSNPLYGTLTRINLSTNNIDATIDVGGTVAMVFNPAGTFAYLARSNGEVSRINVATNLVDATIDLVHGLSDIAINSAGTFLYVALGGNSTISTINLATNTVVAVNGYTSIYVDGGVDKLAIDPANKFLYVSSYHGYVNRITLVSGLAWGKIHNGPGGARPNDITIDSTGTFAYVANNGSASVSRIFLASFVVDATVTVGTGPLDVVINPAGTFAYVLNVGSETVSRIKLGSEVPVVSTTTTAVPVVTTTLVPNVSTAQFFMDFSVRWSPSWRVVAIYAGLPAPTSARYSVRVITRETCRTYLGYIDALEDGTCTVQVTVKPKVGKSQTKIISFLMETLEP